MSQPDGKFRHESLQDRKTIKALLTALTKGIGAGEITFGEDDKTLVLPVDGLMTLRIKADRSDGACRVDLRISWTEDNDTTSTSAPQIK
ncbi:amphi-Trp domain-containing protein [Nioella nitratireducens]|uniref:amphi-Trp domain-containing protein n=1 Tax=Nioella nitratireducens TaxID=1287720 RepID=UPI0008FD8AC7|nr:amphi-Trp domain-containing protein [Nioella nitratireducens]